MSELVEFLLARLKEDEEVAEKAAEQHGSEWFDDVGMVESAKLPPDREHCHLGMYASEGRYAFWDCEGAGSLMTTAEASAQFARWDPRRVLAQVGAHRRIVERHAECDTAHGYCADGGHGESGVGCAELFDLASVYADHPDYEPEWNPEVMQA